MKGSKGPSSIDTSSPNKSISLSNKGMSLGSNGAPKPNAYSCGKAFITPKGKK